MSLYGNQTPDRAIELMDPTKVKAPPPLPFDLHCVLSGLGGSFVASNEQINNRINAFIPFFTHSCH